MANNGLTSHPSSPLTFYPAYCHSASPTYFAWVKLSAHDVHHALRPQKSFTGTGQQAQLLFYLNHPVQFVYLVGVIVAFDEHFERFWVFTIDDSSGSTIDITCRKPDTGYGNSGTAGDISAQQASGGGSGQKGIDEAYVELMKRIDVGVVVSVKGTIGTFRNVRQVHLERMSILPDTNAEMRFWDQRTRFKVEILSNPWIVSSSKQKRLLKAAQSEASVDGARAMRLKERLVERQKRETRHAAKIARQYAREEVERKRLAEKAREEGKQLN